MRATPVVLAALLLAFHLPGAARASGTLYADLGGREGIARIVDGAVASWQTDPRIKADFDNINFDHLRTRITDFVCQVAGGPCLYKGRSMAASHKGLHLHEAEFDAVAEDLQSAMERVGIPYRTQNRLMALLAPMERDIVTR